MVKLAPIKMLMTGGWFIYVYGIVLTTKKKNTCLGPFKVGLFFIIKEKLVDGS